MSRLVKQSHHAVTTHVKHRHQTCDTLAPNISNTRTTHVNKHSYHTCETLSLHMWYTCTKHVKHSPHVKPTHYICEPPHQTFAALTPHMWNSPTEHLKHSHHMQHLHQTFETLALHVWNTYVKRGLIRLFCDINKLYITTPPSNAVSEFRCNFDMTQFHTHIPVIATAFL